MSTKSFRVFNVSEGHNAFGLYGHILVARDGMAFEVGRAKGAWNEEWTRGKDVSIPVDALGEPQWHMVSCEIPHRLAACPEGAVREFYGNDGEFPDRKFVEVVNTARELIKRVREHNCKITNLVFNRKAWELLQNNQSAEFVSDHGFSLFNYPVALDREANELVTLNTQFLPT